MSESKVEELVPYLFKQLSDRNILYMMVNEGQEEVFNLKINDIKNKICEEYRKDFKNVWISNFGYDFESAN